MTEVHSMSLMDRPIMKPRYLAPETIWNSRHLGIFSLSHRCNQSINSGVEAARLCWTGGSAASSADCSARFHFPLSEEHLA